MSTGELREGRQTQKSMPVCAERRGPKGSAEVEEGKGIMGNVDMSDNRSRDGRMELTGKCDGQRVDCYQGHPPTAATQLLPWDLCSQAVF